MLVYFGDQLILVGYTDSNFMLDKNSRKSTSGYMFTLGSGAINQRSVKQSCITDSTTEAEYVAASEIAKKDVWLREFLQDLKVVHVVNVTIKLFCGNSGVVAQSKIQGPKRNKNILRGNIILQGIQCIEVMCRLVRLRHNKTWQIPLLRPYLGNLLTCIQNPWACVRCQICFESQWEIVGKIYSLKAYVFI